MFLLLFLYVFLLVVCFFLSDLFAFMLQFYVDSLCFLTRDRNGVKQDGKGVGRNWGSWGWGNHSQNICMEKIFSIKEKKLHIIIGLVKCQVTISPSLKM